MTAAALPAIGDERERLLRRIADLRARHASVGMPGPAAVSAAAPAGLIDLGRRRAARYAEALATAVDGDVVETPRGRVVRVDRPSIAMAVDRSALASLPGQPPPDVPLVCLDTETTGLGTGTGTVAFLVGLGWWSGDRFRQAQLVLPDHADEPALLEAVRSALPDRAWLVTYNGRGFDWPLLVTRFRLGLSAPPALGGHLDLLPVVRALFRHRLTDARLRTVEAELLRLGRVGDVDGWEIPARYLGFLRDGNAGGLVEVIRHNHEDVRTLARLLVHLSTGLAARSRSPFVDPRDLAALGRALARAGRLDEAISCLEDAAAGIGAVRDERTPSAARPAAPAEPWWSPRVAADIGGPPRPTATSEDPARRGATAWTADRVDRERARVLRQAGRFAESAAAWRGVALAGGRAGALAWIEVAKLEEHRLRDPAAALEAVERAVAAGALLRARGLPIRGLDQDAARRRRRLLARLERRRLRGARPRGVADC
ncbi:MAG TPA: ribonuclease H-like domain-containing protein [Candidatus Limnocylindrales bacterium]